MQALFTPKTEIYKIDLKNPDNSIIERAAEIIQGGGIAVYPTDTLYGFGVDVKNQIAMDRLYELKGRDENKPVSLIINTIKQIENVIGKMNEYEKQLFLKLFPGKITLVYKTKKVIEVPKLSHLKKVGFRVPHSKICKSLIDKTENPITSTSVNISTQGNLKSAKEIYALFNNKVDIILDAGSLEESRGSTVLDLVTSPPTVLREGDIDVKDIEKSLGYKLFKKYPKKFIITFVCSGNICRSPMGQGILSNLIAQTKYKNCVEINSAGTLNINNSPATLEAIDVSMNASVDIAKHKSQGLSSEILRRANLIVCMALDHYNYINQNYPQFRSKAILLKQWQKEVQLSNPSIADPIGTNFAFYEKIFNEISIEIHRIFPEVIKVIMEFREDTTNL